MTKWLLVLNCMLLMGQSARAAGTITLSQTHFTVQEKADFSWVYTVPDSGLDQGDVLRIYDPVFQGMRWSKWGDLSPWWDRCSPQATGQLASWGLVSAHVRRDGERLESATVVVTRSNCDDEDWSCTSAIHESAWTEVTLMEGALQADDEVVVGIGDVGACEANCSEGNCGVCSDCGFEMPDRAFPEIAWPAELCLVDTDCESLDPPSITVESLEVPDLLIATVPSQALLGQPIRLKVALLDRWGNAVTQATHTLQVLSPDGTQTHTLAEGDGGWHDFEITLSEPGIHRIEVVAGAMRTWTNPVEVLTAAPRDQIYWGDIHVHHGYTYVDSDGGTHDLNHDYGRDVAGLDIVSQTQKAKGIEIGEDRLWAELQESCRTYSEPGRYLVLLGFEWMGELAAEAYDIPSEGHHNVYYDACEAPLGTHDLEQIDSVDGELGLWAWLDDVELRHGVRGITVPHATRWTGKNFVVRNPGTQTLAEIYSEWGDNTEWSEGQLDAEMPGTVQDMMNSGMRLGWIGGSDNHDGWMGNPSSQKNEMSGLGAFIAPSLERQALFSAMKHRRTYATTGHRPILRFEVEDGGERLGQGSEVIAREPILRWRYNGTDSVDQLRLFRIRIQPLALQEVAVEAVGVGKDLTGELALGPISEGSIAYWLEVRQRDGEVAWSSPIWVTDECARVAYGAIDMHGRCDDREAEAEADESGVRCGCAQSPRQGGLWLILVMFGLIRRNARASQRRAQH